MVAPFLPYTRRRNFSLKHYKSIIGCWVFTVKVCWQSLLLAKYTYSSVPARVVVSSTTKGSVPYLFDWMNLSLYDTQPIYLLYLDTHSPPIWKCFRTTYLCSRLSFTCYTIVNSLKVLLTYITNTYVWITYNLVNELQTQGQRSRHFTLPNLWISYFLFELFRIFFCNLL